MRGTLTKQKEQRTGFIGGVRNATARINVGFMKITQSLGLIRYPGLRRIIIRILRRLNSDRKFNTANVWLWSLMRSEISVPDVGKLTRGYSTSTTCKVVEDSTGKHYIIHGTASIEMFLPQLRTKKVNINYFVRTVMGLKALKKDSVIVYGSSSSA